MNDYESIRNIAVIAHVDHGKTTMVDALLKQTNVFRENQQEMNEDCILDSNALERERGITIMAKNCAVIYKNTKINIIDTPGHADFSGEVERTLGMADGALLIVDAQEGPMPQTRFVLKQALKQKLKMIVVVNKIEKKMARVEEVVRKVADLFLELAQEESELDFPVLYAIGRQGKVFSTLPESFDALGTVLPLLDTVLEVVPPPLIDTDAPFKMLISSLDYDAHLGKIAIGRIYQGTIGLADRVVLVGKQARFAEVASLMVYKGLDRVPVDRALAGDVVALSGIEQVGIGMTLATAADSTPLPTLEISEPTVHITIGPNTSPFNGKEGRFFTARQIEARLDRELESNVSLRLEKLTSGQFRVSGRGELHLSVLLETMRREGYEMEVAKPEAVVKMIEGIVHEPVEECEIVVPNEYVGVISQELGKRYAELVQVQPISDTETSFEYITSTRSSLGLRSILLNLTKGTVVINSRFMEYRPVGQEIPQFRKGVIISDQTGRASEYGLRNLKGRGISFIVPGVEVYQGMIVGLHAKDDDISMNVCKEKNLTNHRSKSHQGIVALAPDIEMSLEACLDFLAKDELLEITPHSLRLRKKLLTDLDRRRNNIDRS